MNHQHVYHDVAIPCCQLLLQVQAGIAVATLNALEAESGDLSVTDEIAHLLGKAGLVTCLPYRDLSGDLGLVVHYCVDAHPYPLSGASDISGMPVVSLLLPAAFSLVSTRPRRR